MNMQPERFRMETNFEGLIKLLAEHLYSEPDVFVRELVQNANDSIIRRSTIEPDLSGRIDVSVDGHARMLIFRDNGIGMDRQDIRDFLSVIGSSGTGATKHRLKEQGERLAFELIGQFGIGMLSAFVVAERVVVRTRKLGSHEAFAWHNSGLIDCELYPDDKQEAGSEIVITVAPEYSFMLDEKRLCEAVIKYCEFIQFPIRVNGAGPINAIDAPWHKTAWTSDDAKEAAYRDFLARRYPDLMLDVMPIEINSEYSARGALFISDRSLPDINTTGVLDIYVRRMLIRASDGSLLPPWAKFVRGVIDSADLQPTASRNEIQRAHPSFEYLREQLGQLIVERLAYLAEFDPERFARINLWHHYHLKGMAFYHDDFFEKVADLLLFETSKGRMSLRRYLETNSAAAAARVDGPVPIYYFAYSGAATQFYRLAEARGWTVINAGQSFEEDLLKKYAERHGEMVRLERLDATDDPELFLRLERDEEEKFRPLELDLEGHLFRCGISNVRVQMRRFSPADLPAIILQTPETEAEEKLQQLITGMSLVNAMEDIAREALAQQKRRPQYLSLNADNPLIRQLLVQDRRNEMVREIMLGIYNSALLYSHNMLTQNNAEAIHEQFVRLFEMILGDRDTLAAHRLNDEELEVIG